MNNNHVWVVTFHFDRGHSEQAFYNTKELAFEAIKTLVFKNEDCINCTVYRTTIPNLKAFKK